MLELKIKRTVANVKGRSLEFNETLAYNEQGEEVYIRELEMYNDLKLFEEFERVTGESLLTTRHYQMLSDEFE